MWVDSSNRWIFLCKGSVYLFSYRGLCLVAADVAEVVADQQIEAVEFGQFGRQAQVAARRLKALEDENAKLKRLLAEQMLDMAAMKELLSKKW